MVTNHKALKKEVFKYHLIHNACYESLWGDIEFKSSLKNVKFYFIFYLWLIDVTFQGQAY